MELQPPGVPATDPFLTAMHRRHPDVGVVVLAPGVGPPGPPDPPDRPGEAFADEVVTAALEATCAAATGALVVELLSAPLPVGRKRAHELVRS
jgi:hypothetical protein